MQSIVKTIGDQYKKAAVVDVRSGDTVKVHQKIREGNKERIQIFQGLVIRTDRKNSHTSRITLRRVASGIGVEKSFLMHSPLTVKVEVVKRSKVRRNYLSYMRSRTGKSARMTGIEFDSDSVNAVHDVALEAEEAKLKEAVAKEAAIKAEEKSKQDAKLAAKAEAVEARHHQDPTEADTTKDKA